MQLGTLAAVVIYFWSDLVRMVVSLFSDIRSNGSGNGLRGFSVDSWVALYIVIGTIPVGIIGLALKNVIEGAFTKSLTVIGGSLIVLACLLWLAERLSKHLRTFEQINWKDALVIGCAQAVALVPGSSRSGTTMTAALFLGITRNAAARFSFLLSIPAVFASGLFEMMRIDPRVFQLGVSSLVVATLVSALAGYAAIAWLLRYLMKNSTMAFVWYRLGLGLLILSLLYRGLIQS
jgi:undecaprenyl-diphosphatase